MAIFTHVVLGTNDVERSRMDTPEFLITRPRNGQPACFA
jgi:hypothetical protein